MAERARKPRLIIADDHELVSAGLVKLLEEDFDIAGTAVDGRSAVELAVRLRPDAILLDIGMPLLNGLEAARQVKHALPRTKLIFVTMHAKSDYVREAFRLGASGYVLKQAAGTELIAAIREALGGRHYMSPGLLANLNERSRNPEDDSTSVFQRLTPRQREVLQLIAEGKSAKEAAYLLHISPKTIEFHKMTMMGALGIKTTAALVRYAVEQGWVAA